MTNAGSILKTEERLRQHSPYTLRRHRNWPRAIFSTTADRRRALFEQSWCGTFPPFAADAARHYLTGSKAQETGFAKFGPFPDSGPSS